MQTPHEVAHQEFLEAHAANRQRDAAKLAAKAAETQAAAGAKGGRRAYLVRGDAFVHNYFVKAGETISIDARHTPHADWEAVPEHPPMQAVKSIGHDGHCGQCKEAA